MLYEKTLVGTDLNNFRQRSVLLLLRRMIGSTLLISVLERELWRQR